MKHFFDDKNFDANIEKRDDFDATTKRETIFVHDICFLDVANAISKNKIFETISDEITNNVNINVDSLAEKNVTKNVDIAIIAFDVEFKTTNDCFDIQKNVNNAIIVDIVFDVNVTIF